MINKVISICTFLSLIFIAPINLAKAQQSAKPWLGVAIDKGEKGVKVEKALPDTPALKAGILPLDEIIKVDESKVTTPRELIDAVTNKGIGHTVTVEILRKGKKLVKKITLVGRPEMLEVAKKALVNKTAPNFKAKVIKGLDSQEFELSAQKGSVVILDFWATWCPPCIASYPQLIEFAKKYKKVKVVAISNEPVKKIKKFIGKNPNKIKGLKDSPLIYLQNQKGAKDIGQLYYSNSIPMFVLIDKLGNVVDITVGGGVMLEAILQKALQL